MKSIGHFDNNVEQVVAAPSRATQMCSPCPSDIPLYSRGEKCYIMRNLPRQAGDDPSRNDGGAGRAPSQRDVMKYVLTIAGHDLSSGAGITKDLEVFSALGLHGLSVPTSFVVQGPTGADRVVPVPIEVFSRMLEKAGEAFSLSGIKVGVLAGRAPCGEGSRVSCRPQRGPGGARPGRLPQRTA